MILPCQEFPYQKVGIFFLPFPDSSPRKNKIKNSSALLLHRFTCRIAQGSIEALLELHIHENGKIQKRVQKRSDKDLKPDLEKIYD